MLATGLTLTERMREQAHYAADCARLVASNV